MAAGMPMMMLANATGSRRQMKKRYDEQVDDYHKRRSQHRDRRRHLARRRARSSGDATSPTPRPCCCSPPVRAPACGSAGRGTATSCTCASAPTTCPPTSPSRTRPATRTRVRCCGPRPTCRSPSPCARPASSASPDRPRSAGRSRCGRWPRSRRCTARPTRSWRVLLGSSPSRDWDWVKWLPHARNDDGHPRPVRIATDEDTRSAMISELMGELEARRELDEKQVAGATRWVVVLDGAREIRMSPGMVSLLKDGPRVGLYFICLDRTVRELPEECRAVASFENGQLNLETNEQRHVDAVRPDLVSEPLARAARARAGPDPRRLDRGPRLDTARREPAARRARAARARRRLARTAAGRARAAPPRPSSASPPTGSSRSTSGPTDRTAWSRVRRAPASPSCSRR